MQHLGVAPRAGQRASLSCHDADTVPPAAALTTHLVTRLQRRNVQVPGLICDWHSSYQFVYFSSSTARFWLFKLCEVGLRFLGT